MWLSTKGQNPVDNNTRILTADGKNTSFSTLTLAASAVCVIDNGSFSILRIRCISDKQKMTVIVRRHCAAAAGDNEHIVDLVEWR